MGAACLTCSQNTHAYVTHSAVNPPLSPDALYPSKPVSCAPVFRKRKGSITPKPEDPSYIT